MELQHLAFALKVSSCFGVVFPHHVPIRPFGMVMQILWHFMLGVGNFHFDFMGVTVERLFWVSEDTGLLNSVGTAKDYGDF